MRLFDAIKQLFKSKSLCIVILMYFRFSVFCVTTCAWSKHIKSSIPIPSNSFCFPLRIRNSEVQLYIFWNVGTSSVKSFSKFFNCIWILNKISLVLAESIEWRVDLSADHVEVEVPIMPLVWVSSINHAFISAKYRLFCCCLMKTLISKTCLRL